MLKIYQKNRLYFFQTKKMLKFAFMENLNFKSYQLKIKNNEKQYAYAFGLFPNPKTGKSSYLDGCILGALGLKRQKSIFLQMYLFTMSFLNPPAKGTSIPLLAVL